MVDLLHTVVSSVSGDYVAHFKFPNTKGHLSNALIKFLNINDPSDLKCLHNTPTKKGSDIHLAIFYNKNTTTKSPNSFVKYLRHAMSIRGMVDVGEIRGPALVLNVIFNNSEVEGFSSIDPLSYALLFKEDANKFLF